MANNFYLEIITPSKSFYKGDCEMVIVKTKDGEEGFMARHSWACKLLGVGEMWIKEAGSDKFKAAFISGGFIDVKDSIIIFTNTAEWREDIDKERVLNKKHEAEVWLEENRETALPVEINRAELTVLRAEERLKTIEGTKRDL